MILLMSLNTNFLFIPFASLKKKNINAEKKWCNFPGNEKIDKCKLTFFFSMNHKLVLQTRANKKWSTLGMQLLHEMLN